MHAALRLNELPTANSRCALARPAPGSASILQGRGFDEAHVRNCGPLEEKCASSLVLLRSSCC